MRIRRVVRIRQFCLRPQKKVAIYAIEQREYGAYPVFGFPVESLE